MSMPSRRPVMSLKFTLRVVIASDVGILEDLKEQS